MNSQMNLPSSILLPHIFKSLNSFVALKPQSEELTSQNTIQKSKFALHVVQEFNSQDA